jgi:hypothetical protein
MSKQSGDKVEHQSGSQVDKVERRASGAAARARVWFQVPAVRLKPYSTHHEARICAYQHIAKTGIKHTEIIVYPSRDAAFYEINRSLMPKEIIRV